MKKLIAIWMILCLMVPFALANAAAEAPADAPTREAAEADGMALPEPADGGSLYLGEGSVSQAGKLYVAFTLSADGASLGQIVLFIKDANISASSGGSTTNVSITSSTVTLNGPISVTEEVGAGDVRLTDFAIDGDAASAVLHYTFRYQSGGLGAFGTPQFNTIDVPFDDADIQFAKID